MREEHAALTALVEQLAPFQSILIEDGRVILVMGFRPSTVDELAGALAERRPGDSLEAHRFPDGWKVTIRRML